MEIARQVLAVIAWCSRCWARRYGRCAARGSLRGSGLPRSPPGRGRALEVGGAARADAAALAAPGEDPRTRAGGGDVSARLRAAHGAPAVKESEKLAAAAVAAARRPWPRPGDSLLGITLVQNKTGNALSVPMQILLLLTVLTLLPAILMCADAVPADRGGAALPAAGAGNADRAVQPGAGGTGAVSFAAGDAAGGRAGLSPRLGAAGARRNHAPGRRGTRPRSRSRLFC